MVWPGEPGMLEPGLEQILSDDDLVGYKKTHKWLSVITTSVRKSVSHDPQPPCHLHIHVMFTPKHSNVMFGFYTVWMMRRDWKACVYISLSTWGNLKYQHVNLMIRSFICKSAKWMSASVLWFYDLKILMPVYGEWTVAAAGLNVAQLNELFT